MENKASKTRSLKIAFVMDAHHLQRLKIILGEVGDSLEYTIKFSDGSSVQYSDIKDIINLPNPARKAITSLTANAAREGQSASVIVKTSSEPYVEYTISGTQQKIAYFGEQLDDWIATIKQWYSWFLDGAGSAIFYITTFVFPLFLASRLPDHFPKLRPWALAILAITIVAEILLFKLFPKGTFAIGDGIRRYRVITNVRTVCLVGYLISLLGSVSANLVKWP
jgi:hypothetical protein